MIFRTAFPSLLALIVLPAALFAEEQVAPVVPLIQQRVHARGMLVFPSRGREQFMPLEIRSAEEAKGRFTDAFMTKLTESVDWKRQVVLVFAWSGSGGDKLPYTVNEGMPIQATFTLKHGRTFDLRHYNHVYVLRNDVKWAYEEG